MKLIGLAVELQIPNGEVEVEPKWGMSVTLSKTHWLPKVLVAVAQL